MIEAENRIRAGLRRVPWLILAALAIVVAIRLIDLDRVPGEI